MDYQTDIVPGWRIIPNPPIRDRCPKRQLGITSNIVYLADGKHVYRCDIESGSLEGPIPRTQLGEEEQ